MWKALASSAVVGASLFAGISTALADGMPSYGRMPCCAPNWSGVYFGGHLGAGWADTEWIGPSAFFGVNRFSTNPDGLVGGGHVGVQHQWGNVVAGVEVSYDGSRMRETVVGPVAIFPQDAFQTKVNDLFSVVGRLGYAQGGWMAYAKGGYANGEVELSGVSGPPLANATFSTSDRPHGFTVGSGLEWMATRNIVLGLEYNYVYLRGDSLAATTGGTVPGAALAIDLGDVRMQTLMARVSFKFDRDRGPLK